MLTEQDVQKFIDARIKVRIPWIKGIVALLVASVVIPVLLIRYFGLPGFGMVIFLVPGLLLSFVPGHISDQRTFLIELPCPFCNAPIGNLVLQMLARTKRYRTPTFTCPECGMQVLDYRRRSQAAIRRLSEHRKWDTKRQIHWVPWSLFLVQILITIREAGNPYSYLAAPSFNLIGVGLALYCWIRSRNSRCLFPLFASLVLLAITFWRFWIYYSAL